MNVLNVYSKEQIDNMELSTYSKVEIDAKIAELNSKIDNKEVFYSFTSFEEFRNYLRTHDMRVGDNISIISRGDDHLFSAYVMVTEPKITDTEGVTESYVVGLCGVGTQINVPDSTANYFSGGVEDMTMSIEDATTVFNLYKYELNRIRLVPLTMNNNDTIQIYITSKE